MLWLGRNKFRDFELVDKMGGVHRIVTNPKQWFDEESEEEMYTPGTTLVVEDMVFKYCKSRATPGGQAPLPLPNRGVVNTHLPVLASAVTAAAAAAKSIEATVAGIAADSYKDGYIIQQPQTGWTQNAKLRIKGNTLTAFELKEGLKVAVKADDNLFFSKNMYAAVGKNPVTGPDYAYRQDRSFVAVPVIDVTSGYHFWGQVWGPCCLQFGDATYRTGDTSYADWGNRVAYFDYYGAGCLGSEPEAGGIYKAGRGVQRAGYCIPCTYDTEGIVDWSILVFLQLTPW